jgi:hypothetical protein
LLTVIRAEAKKNGEKKPALAGNAKKTREEARPKEARRATEKHRVIDLQACHKQRGNLISRI